MLVAGTLGSLFGPIRWEDAYRALGVVDPGPHALALAMAEGEVPDGMPTGPRLYPFGTLMRVRWDELDAAGTTLASHEVRALVPGLPFIGGDAPGSDYGTLECLSRCRAQLAAANATLIERGGQAGLAEEWLLRMPVGQEFTLARSDLKIQDIGEPALRAYPVAPLRVTVLETCRASVRIGAAWHLDYLMFPIPRALRRTRWVQLEGCSAMMNAPPAPDAKPPPAPAPTPLLRKTWLDRADWEAVRPQPVGGRFRATLVIDDEWLAAHPGPRTFQLLRACRYDAAQRQWRPLPPPEGDAEINPQPAGQQGLAYSFPADAALYFAEWTETAHGVTGPPHRILMPSGTETCTESSLRPAGAGEVVGCVPTSVVGTLAEAQVLPDPALACEAAASIAR